MPRASAPLRRAAAIVYGTGVRRGLLAFRIADSHWHALLCCSRGDAGRFAQATSGALTKAGLVPAGFESARVRPIEGERHLANSMRYLFRQEQHHGTNFDPAHDGSSLPELLGLRQLGGPLFAGSVALRMPRLGRSELLEFLWPEPRPRTQQLALVHLAEAAAAAFHLEHLRQRGAPSRQARRAALCAAALAANPDRPTSAPANGGYPLGYLVVAPTVTELADALLVTSRSIRDLRSQPVDPSATSRVLRQWSLRSFLSAVELERAA